LVALEFIFVGNMMGKIRMNWFVGARFPWTLENDEVWNKTNRLSGKLFVASGTASIIAVFFPPMVTFSVLLGSILLSTVASILYSYLLYRRL
jgi:uncharacterized membrane protein